ncbi:nuclear pore complex protein NUP62 [Amborella trichopoda]|uniref:nuclear pore complex protein NUP62 n=1 Tax=Amborella trichopoda TaxID=13333 RepID=UPI0005D3B31F|nr:nuclear pore complex protein NUP62 [Amborella trichopoda]|eukprot:XP_011622232.1 nuclear pore complex protein NUP62 [Amborella trichopoda]
MNSNARRMDNSGMGSVNHNKFDFDFGLGGASSNNQATKPLSNKRQQNPPYKPSWTHQPISNPAPKPTQYGSSGSGLSGLSNPTSMVGDIFGKSWTTSTPSSYKTSGLVGDSKANLFGDLLGPALGQGKSNAPLKETAPKNSFSMGNLSDALPKSTPLKSSSSWGSVESLGSLPSQQPMNKGNINTNSPSDSMTTGIGASKSDPFGNLFDFGSKSSPASIGQKNPSSSKTNAAFFGDFQKASPVNQSFASNPIPGMAGGNMFSAGSATKSSDPFAGVSSSSNLRQADAFSMPTHDFSSQNQAPKSKIDDPLDTLFSSLTSSAPVVENPQSQAFSGDDDWGLGSEFGGNDEGPTTELEGLPPPPAGVSASMAKSKGIDNQKQGQYADAIKWLSWAVTLMEKAGNSDSMAEVLMSRASCYKEVGEYKKAVADCSKVLDHDTANVSVLLQRALLYESTEKYKLGAEDLRMVLKIDPGNRLARNTLHRLAKLAD